MPTPKPGDLNYGTAPEGSLSEERAKKAAIWVEKEVYKLLGEIESIGRANGNTVEVTFGELFVHYEDVSDTLVGIMARAKKRGLIQYEGQGGQMLFQGKHDKVVVTLDRSKSAQWRKEYLSGTQATDSPSSAASATPKKQLTVKEQYEEEKKKRQSATPPSATRSEPTYTTPPKQPAQSPRPAPVETKTTESHSGFLATMMGKLLPSPQTSPQGSPPVQKEIPETHTAPQQTHSDNTSLTKSIMSGLSKLLPTHGSNSELDDGTLNAIKMSAAKAKAVESHSSSESASTSSHKSAPAGALSLDTSERTVNHVSNVIKSPRDEAVSNTREIPMIHAALPQRTRDGTRGAVLKQPPSPPRASASANNNNRPISMAINSSNRQSAPAGSLPKSPKPVNSGVVNVSALKKEQEEWAKKHISRGIVNSASATKEATTSSSHAKLAPFQESKHKSTPLSSSNVTRKTAAFEKSKQSSTLPTGLQRKFAWE